MPLGEYLAASMAAGGEVGSGGSDAGADEVDSVDGPLGNSFNRSLHAVDPERARQAIGELRSKVMVTMNRIKALQEKKEEDVNKFLIYTDHEDPHAYAATKTKAAFEKQNQKSGQKILQLQLKLEKYRKKIDLLETGIAAPDKQQSRGPVEYKRGVSEVHSTPKTSEAKRKSFGSADDILGTSGEGGKAGKLLPRTLPAGFKYHSDEELAVAAQAVCVQQQGSAPPLSDSRARSNTTSKAVDTGVIMAQLESNRKLQESLMESMNDYRVQTSEQIELLKRELDKHKLRVELLHSHIMEFSDCRRIDSDNLRQELARLEERGDYRLEERVRDMQEMLDNCKNRITRMEMQSLSLDLMESTHYSLMVTKLINVALAILAVIFVLVSAVAGVAQPLYATRGRLALTGCILACALALWQLWPTMGLRQQDL